MFSLSYLSGLAYFSFRERYGVEPLPPNTCDEGPQTDDFLKLTFLKGEVSEGMCLEFDRTLTGEGTIKVLFKP